MHALRLFKALRLLFLTSFPGPTVIPCPTSIPDSRVRRSRRDKSRVNRKSRYLKSGYSTMYLYSTTHYVLHFSSLLLAGGYSYRMLIVLLLLMTLEFTLGGIIFNKVQKSQ